MVTCLSQRGFERFGVDEAIVCGSHRELSTAQSLVPETMDAVRPQKNVPSSLACARWVHHWLASCSERVPAETAWATCPPMSSWRKLNGKVTVRKVMETSVMPTSRKRRGSWRPIHPFFRPSQKEL